MYSDSEKENSMTPDNRMRYGPAEIRAEDDCTELHGVQYADTLPVTDEPETPDADIRISPDEGAGKTGENTDRENTEDQSVFFGAPVHSDFYIFRRAYIIRIRKNRIQRRKHR